MLPFNDFQLPETTIATNLHRQCLSRWMGGASSADDLLWMGFFWGEFIVVYSGITHVGIHAVYMYIYIYMEYIYLVFILG